MLDCNHTVHRFGKVSMNRIHAAVDRLRMDIPDKRVMTAETAISRGSSLS